MRTAIIAAALVAGMATAAAAQSNDTAFNGFYAGAQVGYDSFNVWNENADGIQGGFFAGYNYRVDNIVVGAEAQLGLSDADTNYNNWNALVRESYGITARAGMLVGAGTLAYAHGGWVKTKFKFVEQGFDNESVRSDGWKIGVGLETLVAQNISLRAEYAYSDFENKAGFEPKNSSFQVGVGYHF